MADGPSTDTPFSRDQVSVEILGVIQKASQGFHMAVNHIAGAVSLWVSISLDEGRRFGTQFQDSLQAGPLGQRHQSPGLEFSHLFHKAQRVRGMVNLPDPGLDLKEILLPALAARADFDKSVEETADNHNRWE